MFFRSVFFCSLLVLASCSDKSSDVSTGRVGATGKNAILIIIDTLRADHLSCYGYERNTSPTTDSLAGEGTLWSNTMSQAPWTLPSHASIWTGLSVKSHGTNHIGGIDGFDMQLDTELPSIPTVLHDAGYQTAGFVNFMLLGEEFGFNHGFDWYDCDKSGDRTASATIDAFFSWLDNQADSKNFFCVIHFYDVHAPYDPGAPYDTAYDPNGVNSVTNWELTDDGQLLDPEDRQHLIDMYDSEILCLDNQLSRLFRGLRQRGLADSTLFVLTSDHGEEFLDHGWVGHGHALYQEQVWVPLVMSGPGIDSGRVSAIPAASYDIMPTIISYLGVEIPVGVEGIDLLSDNSDVSRAIPSSGISPDRSFLARIPVSEFQSCAVREDSEKVIAYIELDDFLQFSLGEDPAEKNPVQADSAMIEKALYYWATPMRGNPLPVGGDTDEINSRLRDMGYVR